MSRFEQEFALVPMVARVIAGVSYAAIVVVMPVFFVLAPRFGGELPPMVWLWFALSLVPALLVPAFILLVGYVFGDARRRSMNPWLWTLLVVFVPNAIGFILYFILRSPAPLPCPQCGTAVGKDLAHCPRCGASVRAACPQCHRPAGVGWTHCGHCGAALDAPPTTR
jgi:hypothetical protein